jgi:hypothetical protein
MFKKILIVLLLIVVAFVVIVALQPSHYSVSRTATFAAPAPVVFAQVNDFHKWEAWSPWVKLDPACKTSYEGAPSGNGAIFSWTGNKDVGEGRMTILESRPNELVKIKLDFVKPFESTATSEFALQPKANQTQVTWTMSGGNNFIGKAFCMFCNMDKMIGRDFERGLTSMKTAAEAAAKN